jgi:hypothetical protein
VTMCNIGGLHPAAGVDSNFIIGGSNWESGAGCESRPDLPRHNYSEAHTLVVYLSSHGIVQPHNLLLLIDFLR